MRSAIDVSSEYVNRVSSDPTDPGYREDYRDFVIFLNGEIVQYVRTADAIMGEVTCTLTNELGPVASGDEWVQIKRVGQVEIRRRAI